MSELTEVPGHELRRHGAGWQCTCGVAFPGRLRSARQFFLIHRFDVFTEVTKLL